MRSGSSEPASQRQAPLSSAPDTLHPMPDLQPPAERTVVRTYHGHDRPDVFVTIDGDEYRGELRAWSVDGEGTWWAHVEWSERPGSRRLGIFHETQVRLDGDLPG